MWNFSVVTSTTKPSVYTTITKPAVVTSTAKPTILTTTKTRKITKPRKAKKITKPLIPKTQNTNTSTLQSQQVNKSVSLVPSVKEEKVFVVPVNLTASIPVANGTASVQVNFDWKLPVSLTSIILLGVITSILCVNKYQGMCVFICLYSISQCVTMSTCLSVRP